MIKESGDAGTIARAAADCLLSATALDSEKNNCAQWTWQVTDLEMSELYCKLDPLYTKEGHSTMMSPIGV